MIRHHYQSNKTYKKYYLYILYFMLCILLYKKFNEFSIIEYKDVGVHCNLKNYFVISF